MPKIEASSLRVILGLLRIYSKILSRVERGELLSSANVSSITPKINSMNGVHPISPPLIAIVHYNTPFDIYKQYFQ